MPRVDLSDAPLSNVDLVVFVDGSASRETSGVNRTGFAVITPHGTVSIGKLPFHFCAQAAELEALYQSV